MVLSVSQVEDLLQVQLLEESYVLQRQQPEGLNTSPPTTFLFPKSHAGE